MLLMHIMLVVDTINRSEEPVNRTLAAVEWFTKSANYFTVISFRSHTTSAIPLLRPRAGNKLH